MKGVIVLRVEVEVDTPTEAEYGTTDSPTYPRILFCTQKTIRNLPQKRTLQKSAQKRSFPKGDFSKNFVSTSTEY